MGVGRPVRLYLGCSIYSQKRGPRPADVVERIRASSLERKVKRTVHPRAKGNRKSFPQRRFAQPIDEPEKTG